MLERHSAELSCGTYFVMLELQLDVVDNPLVLVVEIDPNDVNISTMMFIVIRDSQNKMNFSPQLKKGYFRLLLMSE